MTKIARWQDSTVQHHLDSESVHVWTWQHGAAPDSLDLSSLSPDEIERCRRFRSSADQSRFATAHGNTRRILAGYLGKPSASLMFAPGEGGKPRLVATHGRELQFSLSHSKNLALLAVAGDLQVGVDIEEPRRIRHSLAERYLSAVELEMLSQLREEQWLPAFLRCWTRKEAILKAEGVGLRLSLRSFDVSLKPDDPPTLLAVRPPAIFCYSWQLYDVSPAANSFASLAVSHAPADITLFRYQPG